MDGGWRLSTTTATTTTTTMMAAAAAEGVALSYLVRRS
jgi:hypothetical protein